jgi:hypothetical protein
LLDRKNACQNELIERPSLDQFHGQKVQALGFLSRMERHNVRMVQRKTERASCSQRAMSAGSTFRATSRPSSVLRVLQKGEFESLGSTQTQRVNVRLVAATNRDLANMVSRKQFRSDPYYRLNVFPIAVPPLRDRPEDIPFLVAHFVKTFAEQMAKQIHEVPAQVMEALVSQSWPGNIRELQNRTILHSNQGRQPNIGNI